MARFSTSFALRAKRIAILFLVVLSRFAHSAQPPDAVVAAVEANGAAVNSTKEIARSDSAALLRDEIAKADAEIDQARIAGNTLHVARVQALRTLCEKALETLETTGDATFPDTIQREIRPTIDSIAERLSKIRDRRDVSLGAAEKVLHNAVRDALQSEALPATESDIGAAISAARDAIALRSPSANQVVSATSESVSVHVESRPAGAAVFVDGKPVPAPDGKPLVTPCEIPLPQSGATLELRLAGFSPTVFPNIQSDPEQRIVATLTRDPDYLDRVVEVRATVANSFASVILKQGRRYRLSVEGTWACDPEQTPTDWRGYDPDKHPGLYDDTASPPRLTDEANVGALVFSAGKGGTWCALPDGTSLAPKNTGLIRFDINEGGGAKARMDNTGLLRVRIQSL